MKEKNGFTRVELSGIVLIIIIIIIIFITIGNVIMKARENAFKNSVYGVIDGGRLLSISQQLQGKSPEVTITFQNKKPNDSAFKVSGDFPDKGTIHLNKEGTIELKLWNKKLKRCIEKTVKQDDIMITNTKEDDCKIEITDIPTNISPTFTEIMKLSDEVMKNDPDGNPRYVGPDPHNYITFNNELWRIIGVFNGQAKIIRNEPYSTSLSWDTNSSDWSKASLQQELNNTYLNQIDIASKLLIDTLHTWSLGGWGTYNITRSEIYNYERGNIVYNDNQATWTGAIGLMYPSDYGYATNSQSDICDTTIINNLANESASSECRDKNWLHNKLYNQWTMTPTSENSIFGITSYGAIYRVYVYGTSLSSSPVLYLKPEIKIIDGKGTQENPYQISI